MKSAEYEHPYREEPSELELLILPYLSGELTGDERIQIEREIVRNPEFARLVEEFRETLAIFEMETANEHEADLEHIEEQIYREIAARRTRELAHLKRNDAFQASFRVMRHVHRMWRTWVGAVGATAAVLMVGLYLATRAPMLAPFSPVARLNVPSPTYSVPPPKIHHERFRRLLIERRLDEAQRIQYLEGDAEAALPVYDEILTKDFGTWMAEVAKSERTLLLRTVQRDSRPFQLLFADATQP